MNHDPLCYMAEGKWDGGCQCALIARVRADCLKKVEGAYIVGTDDNVLTPSHPEYSHDGTDSWNTAISVAVSYLKGLN